MFSIFNISYRRCWSVSNLLIFIAYLEILFIYIVWYTFQWIDDKYWFSETSTPKLIHPDSRKSFCFYPVTLLESTEKIFCEKKSLWKFAIRATWRKERVEWRGGEGRRGTVSVGPREREIEREGERKREMLQSPSIVHRWGSISNRNQVVETGIWVVTQILNIKPIPFHWWKKTTLYKTIK